MKVKVRETVEIWASYDPHDHVFIEGDLPEDLLEETAGRPGRELRHGPGDKQVLVMRARDAAAVFSSWILSEWDITFGEGLSIPEGFGLALGVAADLADPRRGAPNPVEVTVVRVDERPLRFDKHEPAVSLSVEVDAT